MIQLDSFLSTVDGNPGLQQALAAAGSEGAFVDTLVRMGDTHGFRFSEADVRKRLEAARSSDAVVPDAETDLVGVGRSVLPCCADSHIQTIFSSRYEIRA